MFSTYHQTVLQKCFYQFTGNGMLLELSLPNILENFGIANMFSFSHFSRFSSVQSLSRVWLFVTQWTTACQISLSITNSQNLLKFMSTELGMPSNHLISLHPLLLLPSIFPSIRVIFSESVLCIRWPKYWSFSFSISPSNEYSGLTSLAGKQRYLLSLICIPLRRMKQSTLYVPSFHLNSMFLPHHIWLSLFFWLIHIFGYLFIL